MQFCRSDLLRCPAPTSSRLPSTALLSFVNRLVIFEHPSLCLSSWWCNVTSGFFPSFDKYFSRVRSVPDAVAGTLYRGASSLTTWALSRACWLSPAPSSWPNWVATGVPAGPTDPPCPRAWWGCSCVVLSVVHQQCPWAWWLRWVQVPWPGPGVPTVCVRKTLLCLSLCR